MIPVAEKTLSLDIHSHSYKRFDNGGGGKIDPPDRHATAPTGKKMLLQHLYAKSCLFAKVTVRGSDGIANIAKIFLDFLDRVTDHAGTVGAAESVGRVLVVLAKRSTRGNGKKSP